MKRKDYQEYYKETEQIKEIVKKKLGLEDHELVQLCIEILGETIFNSTTVNEFSGCLGGETKTKNGHTIHYNFSLGEMAKEANDRLYRQANEFVNLNKELEKKMS
ncbi:MAG: hypothetical protein ACRC7F_07165 [Cetobacterium sp.]